MKTNNVAYLKLENPLTVPNEPVVFDNDNFVEGQECKLLYKGKAYPSFKVIYQTATEEKGHE